MTRSNLIHTLDGIILDSPAKSTRWTLHALGFLLLSIFVWMRFARLDVVTVTEGRLVPETLVKIVQPAEAGVIREILVKEGEAVHAGQLLIRMNSEILDAERRSTASEMRLRRLSLRRIDAELNERSLQSQPDDDPFFFQQVMAQFQAHRNAYRDNLLQEDATISKIGHDLGAARQGLEKLRQTVPIYQHSAEIFAKLAKEGFVNEVAAAEKQRDRIEKEGDLLAQQDAVASLTSSLDQARNRRNQVVSAYRSQLQNERIETENQEHKLNEDYAKSVYRSGLYELKAPQDGIVKDLATTTEGAVVSPGAVLLNLVPKEELLFADVVIKNEDVSFLGKGLPVKIKIGAYPFQKYGMIDGTVERIASDSSEGKDGKGTQQGPVYRADVRLSRQSLRSPSGENLPIGPGMQVVAEIRQRDRSVMEYLLSPVERVVAEAARER